MKQILSAAVILLFAIHNCADAQIITTIAGGGATGLGDGGPATDGKFVTPISIVCDRSGNYYITDRDTNRIRKVDSTGIISTIAGTGVAGFSGDNGPSTAAKLQLPYGMTMDDAGNIYFSDPGNARIRKIDTSGIITTIAGNGLGGYNGDNMPATDAKLGAPGGVDIDNAGNIYFSEKVNNRVRKIDVSGIITTIAGTGTAGYNGDEIPATDAQLNEPNYVAVDANGNIYVADYMNNRIRKIDTSGIMHTFAGNGIQGYAGDNGQATKARLNRAVGVYVDVYGNVYVGDTYNNVVRKITTNGIIRTIAGNGTAGFSGDNGPPTMAQLVFPVGITTDTAGNIYIADAGNNRIRFITSTLAIPEINNKNSIRIYPNPFTEHVSIRINTDIAETVRIWVTNMLGQRIKELIAQTNTQVDLSMAIPAGIYTINAQTSKICLSEKIIVK